MQPLITLDSDSMLRTKANRGADENGSAHRDGISEVSRKIITPRSYIKTLFQFLYNNFTLAAWTSDLLRMQKRWLVCYYYPLQNYLFFIWGQNIVKLKD